MDSGRLRPGLADISGLLPLIGAVCLMHLPSAFLSSLPFLPLPEASWTSGDGDPSCLYLRGESRLLLQGWDSA